MTKLLLITLLIAGCDNSTEPKPSLCNPDLVCGQVETCCEGYLYPTDCCGANCDAKIGICSAL